MLQKKEQLMAHTSAPLAMPDFESMTTAKFYQLPQHTVTVTDVSAIDFVGSGGFKLGTNKVNEG